MQLLLWALSIAFLSLGLLISGYNGFIFFKALFTRKEGPSWIPLLGGILTAVGMLCMPINGTAIWMWIPLFLDYGCIPGISYSLWYHFVRSKN